VLGVLVGVLVEDAVIIADCGLKVCTTTTTAMLSMAIAYTLVVVFAVRHAFAGPWSCDSSNYLCHCKRDNRLGEWQDCLGVTNCAWLHQIRTLSRQQGDDLRFDLAYHCDPRTWICCGPYPSLHATRNENSPSGV
jgi:hypothetical protein